MGAECRRLAPRVATAVAILVSTLFALGLVYLYGYRGRTTPSPQPDTAHVIRALLPLSAALAVAFIFIVTRGLVGSLRIRSFRGAAHSVSRAGVVLAIAAATIVSMTVRCIADGTDPVTLRSLLGFSTAGSTVKPLAFFVPHVVYYGPVVILVTRYWREFCDAAGTLGLALSAVVMATILIGMTSESRLAIFGFPVIAAIACLAARPDDWSRSQLFAFALVSLAWSKVWLPMRSDVTEASPLVSPLQRYFMQHGPWMANETYGVHAILVLLTIVLLVALLPRSQGFAAPARASQTVAGG
jgi:hypothetical protein